MIHFSRMRVAIVHYWLLGMRGGEKVVEALLKLLPEADVFTLFYDPSCVSDLIRSRNVRASFLNPLRARHRSLLPLMPLALESFDLREYDLIISSESGPAKGVIATPEARHICYCHAPMRYLWDLYPDYLREFTSSAIKRMIMAPIANYLRLWDYASAARVHKFIANSNYTKTRIRNTYRRKSRVIYPPVAVETFYHKEAADYFLIVSGLVPNKRLDYAIRVFRDKGIRLKVAGKGPEFRALKKIAGPSIEFCGRVNDLELRELYARCRALIVPGNEDFGIATAESLASGKPVIALARGGSVEIVQPECGVFYDAPTQHGLGAALDYFESRELRFRPADLRSSVLRFSEIEFHKRMQAVIEAESIRDRHCRAGQPLKF